LAHTPSGRLHPAGYSEPQDKRGRGTQPRPVVGQFEMVAVDWSVGAAEPLTGLPIRGRDGGETAEETLCRSSEDARSAWLATLDPGIASYVDVLDAAGVETFESCEGGSGHAFTEPTVRFYGERSEGFRALAVALQHGLPVGDLRHYWQVDDGEPQGPHWELTFRSTASRSPCTADGSPFPPTCAPV
jgi:hypothetical protein